MGPHALDLARYGPDSALSAPELRRRALDRLLRIRELHEQLGLPVREDVMRARAIIARHGLAGLFDARRRGVALPGFILADSAGLFAPEYE